MADERNVERSSDGQRYVRRLDEIIARLAGGQHGVVARWQLLSACLTAHEIDHRIRAGRLHPVHRGVYAVGHRALSLHGRLMAAVLAGGPGAILSHGSAALIWGMIRSGGSAIIHVTTPRRVRVRDGIRFHVASMPADERQVHHGIPLTSPFRTILDLAGRASAHELERALHQAEIARLSDRVPLQVLVDRYPRRRGAARLRAALATLDDGPRRTRSELEDQFLAFLADRGLPRPETNVIVHAGGQRYEVDCLWRRAKVAVELDSRAFHDTSWAFHQDRRKHRALTVAGLTTLLVTSLHIQRGGEQLEADLRMLLGEHS